MDNVISEYRKEEMRETRKKLIGLFFEIPKEPNPVTSELKPEPKSRRFGYLAKNSGLSEAGLSKILKEFISKGRLKKEWDEKGRPIYVPTEIAIEKAQGSIWYLSDELQELKNNKALYWHGIDYPGRYNFGFSMGAVLDKRVPKDVLPDLLKQIEDYTFKLIANNFRESRQIPKNYSDGKTILAIDVNWHEFTNNLRKIQAFIEDINSNRNIFFDDRLDFYEDRDNLSILYLLVRFSPLFGDKIFEKNLKRFLGKSKDNYELFDIIRINTKLLDEFVKCLDNNENPLEDKRLSKHLLKPLGTELRDNNFSRYIMAARIFRYNDVTFLKKLDDLEIKNRYTVRTTLTKLNGKRDRKHLKNITRVEI